MVTRRSLLLSASSLLLGQLLTACGGRSEAALSVQLLANSIPAQGLRLFRRQVGRDVDLHLVPIEQLTLLFEQLQVWQSSAEQLGGFPLARSQPRPIADLVTLGDFWLPAAIQQGLIQPLDPKPLTQWSNLPDRWQTLVQRDAQGQLDPQGQVWAAPYRWGTMAIVYSIQPFADLGWRPQDWADLWRPELNRRFSLLDHARAVIGLTLKKMGRSLNSENLADIPGLAGELQALQQQVKFYSSDVYLQPLLLEDTWLAVGWSMDIVPLVRRDRRFAAVVPDSGTILTADLWVHPGSAKDSDKPQAPTNSANLSPLANQWIDFFWQEQIAIQLSLLGSGASPRLTTDRSMELPQALQDDSLLLLEPELLQRCEFLQPLSPAATAEYERLWQEMRT